MLQDLNTWSPDSKVVWKSVECCSKYLKNRYLFSRASAGTVGPHGIWGRGGTFIPAAVSSSASLLHADLLVLSDPGGHSLVLGARNLMVLEGSQWY